MELSKPMMRGTTVKLDDSTRWIEFRYEKCPNFCYYCGIMGHNERNYRVKGININKEAQYVAWLRASNARSSTRRQNNSSNVESNGGEGSQLNKEWGEREQEQHLLP